MSNVIGALSVYTRIKKRASLDSREADRKISQNKTTNIEGKTNGV